MCEWVTKWGPQFYEQQNENWVRLAILVEVPTLVWVVGMVIDSFIPDRGQAPLGTGRLCVGRALAFLPLVIWWYCDDQYLKLYLPGRTGLKLGNWHFISIGIPCVVAGLVCQLGVPPRYIDILFASLQALFLAVTIPCMFIRGREEIMRRWDAYCAAIGEMKRERRARMLREEAGQPEEHRSVWEPVNERRDSMASKPFRDLDRRMLTLLMAMFAAGIPAAIGLSIDKEFKRPPGIATFVGVISGMLLAGAAAGLIPLIKTEEDREREALKRDATKQVVTRRTPVAASPKPVPAPVVAKPDPNADLKRQRDERLQEIEGLGLDPLLAQAQKQAIQEDYDRQVAERNP